MRKFLLVTSAIASLSVAPATYAHDGHDHSKAPVTAAAQAAVPALDAAIVAAVAAPSRTPANVVRDAYRHPAETLAFFGVAAHQTIVELFPGGGWYSEILAPLTKDKGTLYAASPWGSLADLQKKSAEQADIYGQVKFAEFPATGANPPVPADSADIVLTFRNVHNWRFGPSNNAAKAFEDIYAMLKPGGVLGVVEHRLNEDADSALEQSSGYMKESSVIAFAIAAGFKLEGRSEVNANPLDTKDHPKGVWSLPPTLALKEVDREKYVAIGESDRMTLKFVKPIQ
jgi:predicted methyltransferase